MTNKTEYTFKEDPQKALQLYFERGYHIEPNMLTHQECDALIEAAKELNQAKEGNYRPAMMPHKEAPIFLDAFINTRITTVIQQLIGGTIVGLQTEFFYGKPGTRGFSLHQDNFFVDAPLGVFASAWTALIDVTPEKGGLIVYPGAHKEGLLPVEKLSLLKDAHQDPNANNEQCVVPSKYKAFQVPLVPKGSTLFIHGHLPHGSNTNLSDEWRYVLLSTYIRQGEKFRPGKYAQRTEVIL